MTETQLEMVNQEADRGNYEKALEQLTEARRLAVSSDNPGQLVRTSLARANILFYLGRTDEAAVYWDEAAAEAELSGDTELGALTRIYQIRAQFLSKSVPASEVIALVEQEQPAITKDRLSMALSWTVIGLAHKDLSHWNEADVALKKALEIHEKDRYLEQAAYDWYLIASVWSVAGDYDSALEALQHALEFDRRAENTYGLSMDWYAFGEVYKKAGRDKEAQAAYTRSEIITQALNNEAPVLDNGAEKTGN
jgi:tetratricopeptide (TPR) repeat protein